MAQRHKIDALIQRAQGCLSQATQENAPLWVGADLQAVIRELERIRLKVLNVDL